jgi:hypothetical protein
MLSVDPDKLTATISEPSGRQHQKELLKGESRY